MASYLNCQYGFMHRKCWAFKHTTYNFLYTVYLAISCSIMASSHETKTCIKMQFELSHDKGSRLAGVVIILNARRTHKTKTKFLLRL